MPPHSAETLLVDAGIYPAEAIDQTCTTFAERCRSRVDGTVNGSVGLLWRVTIESDEGDTSQLIGEFLNAVLCSAIDLHLAMNEVRA